MNVDIDGRNHSKINGCSYTGTVSYVKHVTIHTPAKYQCSKCHKYHGAIIGSSTNLTEVYDKETFFRELRAAFSAKHRVFLLSVKIKSVQSVYHKTEPIASSAFARGASKPAANKNDRGRGKKCSFISRIQITRLRPDHAPKS